MEAWPCRMLLEHHPGSSPDGSPTCPPSPITWSTNQLPLPIPESPACSTASGPAPELDSTGTVKEGWHHNDPSPPPLFSDS